MIEAEFGTDHHRTADVFSGIQRVFRIFRGESGSLALLVIEEVRPESNKKLWIDNTIHIVDDRVFRRGAAQFAGLAKRPVRTEFGCDGIGHIPGDVWYVALVHVPSLSRHMPFAVELVIPGEVIVLQVVVGVFTAIDAIRTTVEIIVIARRRIIQTKNG